MEMIHSALITGASRGIGLEFVKQLLTNSSLQAKIIIATCRSPEEATALQELKKSSERVHILKLDVTKFDTYDELALNVGSIVGDKGLTLLINNAGIAEASLKDSLKDITPEMYLSTFTTNSVAPVILTQRFQNRQLAQQENSYDPTLRGQPRTLTRPCIVNVKSHSNEFKFFDLPQARPYQILKEKC